MGLDGVEIVMKVEETFDIAIGDSDAERCRTPRDLIEVVMRQVGRTDVAVCLTQRAFYRVRRAFISELGNKRSEIQLDANLETFFPATTRKEALAKVSGLLGVDIGAALVRPKRLQFGIAGIGLLTGLGIAVGLDCAKPTASFFFNFLAGLNVWVGIAIALCAWRLGWKATRHKLTEFPEKLTTVRNLSRWLVANNPKLIGAPPGQWSHAQVAEKVRAIVTDVLGCEKYYREDARFIEDLGMG